MSRLHALLLLVVLTQGCLFDAAGVYRCEPGDLSCGDAGSTTGGGTATGGGAATGGGVATGGGTATGGGAATGGGTVSSCVLSPQFARVDNMPLPSLPGIATASVALALDAGVVGLPNLNDGIGTMNSYNLQNGGLTVLSNGPDSGVFEEYAGSVAVDDAFTRIAVTVPYASPLSSGKPVGLVELRRASGALLANVQSVYSTAWCGHRVSLSGDGRTLVYACGTAADVTELGVLRPDGGYTAADVFGETLAEDFELNADGNQLATVGCSMTSCQLHVFGAVQTNIVSPRYDSAALATLSVNELASVEVELSAGGEWAAVSASPLGANAEGVVYVLATNGTTFDVVAELAGTLSQERVGRALAMSGDGTMVLASRARGQTTSVYVQRTLSDGGVDYCEAQRLDVSALTGSQLALSSDGRRALIVGVDGGLQYFSR